MSKHGPENTLGDTPCRTDYPKNSPKNSPRDTFGLFSIVFLFKIEGRPSAAPQRGRRPSAAAPFEVSILSKILLKIVQKYPGDYFWDYFLGILYGMGYPREYFPDHFWEYFLGYLIKRPKSTLGLFFGVFLGVS